MREEEYIEKMNGRVHGSLAHVSIALMGFFLGRVDKVECIKHVRVNTQWGLKESKDYVDACQRLMERRGWKNSGLF